jgi:hypothetical protein
MVSKCDAFETIWMGRKMWHGELHESPSLISVMTLKRNRKEDFRDKINSFE